MRTGHLLFSCLHLFIIILFLALGGIFLELHYLPGLRLFISEWILEPHPFAYWGETILLLTILFGIGFCALQRHQYLRIGMKNSQALVDENLVRQAIFFFWRENFPKQKKPLDVFFAHQKIEIVATLSPKEDWEQSLQEIEIKLGKMLAEKFGYQKEFFVSVKLPKD